jgi:hypothetical protein
MQRRPLLQEGEELKNSASPIKYSVGYYVCPRNAAASNPQVHDYVGKKSGGNFGVIESFRCTFGA